MEKILKLAIDNLQYNEWINLWEYTIKNEFKWKFIYKNDKAIWIIADWVVYINWRFKRSNFEVAVANNSNSLIEFIERKLANIKIENMDIKSELARMESKNIELEKKIQDKAVEDAKTFLNDPFINHE